MKRKKVSELAKQIRGVSYKTEDLHENLDENSVTLLRANNIFEGRINFDDVVYVDKSRVAREQYLCKGDILVCASSGSKQLVGKAASFTFDTECTFGAFCKVVRPNQDVANYLSMYFQSNAYRRKISEVAIGANINNIRNEHIDALELPIGSNAENEKVVASFSLLQQIIDGRKQQLHKLDELIKSRFIELFGDPVSNPHGYPKIPLSKLAEIKIGPFGSLLHKEDYIANGHALVNPSHIVAGKISVDKELTVSDEKFRELSAYHLQVGDVVMGRRGEMGRCAVVQTGGLLCGTGSILIRTKGEVTADYLQKIISFPSFKKGIEDMAVGQTMPNLNVPIVSKFQIIQPPIEVQNAYYTFVEQTDKSKYYSSLSFRYCQAAENAYRQEWITCRTSDF